MPKFKTIYTPPKTPNVVTYLADTGGCGHWRLIWPANELILQDLARVEQRNRLLPMPEYYSSVDAIHLQRQANPALVPAYTNLAKSKDKFNFRMIFESDDIVFTDDIPEYNAARNAFSPASDQAMKDVIACCDEITVSTQYLADYYRSKTGHQKITVVPNYAPRGWLGGYYNRENVAAKFDKYTDKPRVLYAGSPCHVKQKANPAVKDDFSHVIDMIKSTTNEFHWIFMGSVPIELNHLVAERKIEFHPWCKMCDYPKKINELDVNMTIAPLIDNHFNRAKSNIKYLESACFGLPAVCQDMCTYESADIKFKNADGLLQHLRQLRDKDYYMSMSDTAWKYAETMWLDNNINKLLDVYQYPYDARPSRN